MNPPFTIEAFMEVFAAYNAAIWPLQIVAYALGAVAIAALFTQSKRILQLALVSMAILWTFTGIGYHLLSFARINPIAPVFAGAIVLQAVLFVTNRATFACASAATYGQAQACWRSIPCWGYGLGIG